MFSIAHSLIPIKRKLILLYRANPSIAVIILFVAAFLLCMWSITQSLWLDEGITARVVREHPYIEILSVFAPEDFHPPLFYLIMKAWTYLWGTSVIALRMPSVLATLIAGALIYHLVYTHGGRKKALVASALYLCNPLVIYYAQEARMYSIITLWITGLLYVIYPLIIQNHIVIKEYRWYIIYANVFISLAILTFYGSIFFIASVCIILIYQRKYHILAALMPGIVGTIVIIAPLTYQQYIHARNALGTIEGWSLVLGNATIRNIALIPLKFAGGRISFDPKIWYYVIGGIWTIIVWIGVMRGVWKQKILGALFIMPLVLGFVVSFVTPLMQYFRFLYLMPLMALLFMYGYRSHRIHVLMIMGYLVWSILYLAFPQFHREDWKSLARALPTNVVYTIPHSMDALRYYRPYMEIHDIRMLNLDSIPDKIYVIPYTFTIYGIDHRDMLIRYGFTHVDTHTYRDVWFEVWTRTRIISQQHVTLLQ